MSSVLHEPFGPVRQWTWGNGSLSVRTFDQDGNIAQLDSAGLKTYTYDDAFRIIGITDTVDSALSWTYGHDDLDRLINASGPDTTLGYTYDANGNRLSQTGSNPVTFTIAANSNRLTGTTGAFARTYARTYAYDGAGNTTGFAGLTFAYDSRGRMKTSTKSGVTTDYLFNARGQRVKKSTSGVDRYFIYDEDGHLIGEYDSAGALIQEMVWLDDIPVATLRPNGAGIEPFYIHADHLNTPRRISRPADNTIVWRWDSDPFGAVAANEDPDGDGDVFGFGLRFPGQYWDAETGMHYNYYREYDPATGRYVQSDPIGLEGGLNTYWYSNSAPILESDPSGLDPKRDGGSPGTSGIPAITPGFVPGTPQNEELVCSAQQALDNLLYNVTNTLTLGGVDRQREYEHAKRFCDTPPEPGRNDCATLSRQINHAQACAKLYQDWDAKWSPGRHAQKISEWTSRLNTLKMTHRINCTTKCCGAL